MPSDDSAQDDSGTPQGRDERCPGCWDMGDRTERVGTLKCTNRSCRVHVYQADPRGVEA